MENERCFLTEAREILAGKTMVLPEKGHIEALDEYYQVKLIRLANMNEMTKQEALNG